MFSVFAHTANSSWPQFFLAFHASLGLIIEFRTIYINFSTSVVEQITSNCTFGTEGIDILCAQSIWAKCWVNTLILEENVTRYAFIAYSRFYIIDLAFDISWEALVFLDIKSSCTFNANRFLIVLCAILNILNTYFFLCNNVSKWTGPAFTIRCISFTLVRWVQRLTRTTVSNKVPRSAFNTKSKVF